MDQPFILGLGGTTRAGSSTEKALAISLAAARQAGARTEMLAGPVLELPMYAPERPGRAEAAQRLVDLFRRCDGVIIASPAYHGTISGMLKNALDYTEDLSRDARVYFDGCAMGLIACAAGWQGAGQTLATLRAVAHSLRGWPTPLGAMVNTSTPMFDETGACRDDAVRRQLEGVGRQVVEFARMRRSAAPAQLQ